MSKFKPEAFERTISLPAGVVECTISTRTKTHYPSEITLRRVKCHKMLNRMADSRCCLSFNRELHEDLQREFTTRTSHETNSISKRW